ncbi:MAG: acyl-CoA thioester hydrolase [Nocardioidaceae bacterium]|jgi:acyl-CoA thioester hydrolase|nr:acyl-CoA thioester hydrolase [Nocardioidaceae bacterium]
MDEALGPFTRYRTTVPAEWLDYNGHMHDASYGIALSDANEELFASLDLSREYREQTTASLYTVEYHIRYLAECGLGQALSATTLVLAASAKWVHLYTELLRDGSDVAATGESLYLHVDTTRSVTTPLPVDRQHRVQAMVAAHADLPRPSHLGRGVGARV